MYDARHEQVSFVSCFNHKLARDDGWQSIDASEPIVAAGETRLSSALTPSRLGKQRAQCIIETTCCIRG